jgi:hypothetical protein
MIKANPESTTVVALDALALFSPLMLSVGPGVGAAVGADELGEADGAAVDGAVDGAAEVGATVGAGVACAVGAFSHSTPVYPLAQTQTLPLH